MKKKIERKLITDNTEIFIDNNINIKDRIIHLFSDINQESASNVIKGIQLMLIKDSTNPISIYINSFGGCPYSSFSMYDFITSCEVTIKTYVTGGAMSGGSLVFMAGDERYMYENSVLMLHTVTSFIDDKLFAMDIETEECKKIFSQMCQIYSDNSNKSKRQWNNLLKYEDKYYRLEKAIELGFAKPII